MKIVRYLLLTLIVVFSLNSFSQEAKSKNELLKTYSSKLELTEHQTAELDKILTQFNSESEKNKKNRVSHNRMVKRRDLEVQSLLSSDQFEAYIDLRNELEPEATYKFD